MVSSRVGCILMGIPIGRRVYNRGATSIEKIVSYRAATADYGEREEEEGDNAHKARGEPRGPLRIIINISNLLTDTHGRH